MKVFISILLSLTLCACATTKQWNDVSPSQNYVLNSQNIRISGHVSREFDYISGASKQVLFVFFNGEQVLTGHLSNNFSGELFGKYKKENVTSLCSGERKTENWIAVSCIILINEKRTATLTF